jgi:hypothetical protein
MKAFRWEQGELGEDEDAAQRIYDRFLRSRERQARSARNEAPSNSAVRKSVHGRSKNHQGRAGGNAKSS